jgi:hypothetical protein
VRNLDKYESFEGYYDVVVSNISRNVLTDALFNITHSELSEMVYVLFYKDIPDTKAVLLLENFYRIYKKQLACQKVN